MRIQAKPGLYRQRLPRRIVSACEAGQCAERQFSALANVSIAAVSVCSRVLPGAALSGLAFIAVRQATTATATLISPAYRQCHVPLVAVLRVDFTPSQAMRARRGGLHTTECRA
jgi:hypothetical protein